MRSNTIISTLGVLMMLACAGLGFINAFLLGGLGICGGVPLTWGVFGFAVVTSLVPAVAVGMFAGPWWLPALVYSAPLVFSVMAGVLADEWYRTAASIGCFALAFGGAWLFRPTAKGRGS